MCCVVHTEIQIVIKYKKKTVWNVGIKDFWDSNKISSNLVLQSQ